MALVTHGDQNYQNSKKLAAGNDWPGLSIEYRRSEAGCQATPVVICTDINTAHERVRASNVRVARIRLRKMPRRPSQAVWGTNERNEK